MKNENVVKREKKKNKGKEKEKKKMAALSFLPEKAAVSSVDSFLKINQKKTSFTNFFFLFVYPFFFLLSRSPFVLPVFKGSVFVFLR